MIGVLLEFIDPLDAISGELAGYEGYEEYMLQQYYDAEEGNPCE